MKNWNTSIISWKKGGFLCAYSVWSRISVAFSGSFVFNYRMKAFDAVLDFVAVELWSTLSSVAQEIHVQIFC